MINIILGIALKLYRTPYLSFPLLHVRLNVKTLLLNSHV